MSRAGGDALWGTASGAVTMEGRKGVSRDSYYKVSIHGALAANPPNKCMHTNSYEVYMRAGNL